MLLKHKYKTNIIKNKYKRVIVIKKFTNKYQQKCFYID